MPGWEHLQDVWRKVHNRRVREHFRDFVNDPDDLAAWNNFIAQADIQIPRQSLLLACLQDDRDNADMVILRTLLFWVVLGQAQALQTPVYGIPIPSYQEARKFRPQICLYFQEDIADIEDGYSPVTGEISMRLMDESTTSLTEADLTIYANKIRSTFGIGAGFVWQKGRIMCSYTDSSKGYKLQVLCRSQNEGKRVVESVLDVQSHTPDWSLFNSSENAEPASRYPAIPPRQTILGKSRKGTRQRPVANVRFKFALLHLHGLPNPIVLIDKTGRYRNPVVEV